MRIELFSGTLSSDGVISNAEVLTQACEMQFSGPANRWRRVAEAIRAGKTGRHDLVFRAEDAHVRDRQWRFITAALHTGHDALAAAMLADTVLE